MLTVSLQSEQLVDLLLNTIMLSVPISGCRSNRFLSFSHGEYFYSLFQVTINTELLRSLNTTVPRLMKASSLNPSMVAHSFVLPHFDLESEKLSTLDNLLFPCIWVCLFCSIFHQVSVLLNGMLDHSFKERAVRKTQGKQLVEEVLGRWNSLQSWWEGHTSTPESKTATLLLLSKLLQVMWS